MVLGSRSQGPLDLLTRDLSAAGVTAHVITADLDRADGVPSLAERIRAHVGVPTVLYYSPAPTDLVFVPAADLTAELLQDRMPITLCTLLALVRQFLPAMLERDDGAILSAQGAAAVQGRPHMSGWPTVLAAQRDHLQSLAAEVADKGVYVGMLYIGARILGTPFEADYQRRRAQGQPVPDLAAANPPSWPTSSGTCTPHGSHMNPSSLQGSWTGSGPLRQRENDPRRRGQATFQTGA
ncbi:hypothetical protein GCM10010411_92510 [Actinomadura fulvescens]|uniref:Short chain dehydrogenase n=1 Tax=Actinomadura fulvescens TaxID=46160 RepID=A0ABP6DAA9_9ACTN